MKAIISAKSGGPDSLEYTDVADPSPGHGEVLLRVHACSVNYPDVLIIEDKYQVRPPRPFSPGSEVAGEIIAIGEGVSGFARGERVVGITTHGGMAERLALPVSACSPIPDKMTWEVAAATLFTYGTAYHALHDRASLRPGETLLVLGAAGGVGLAAVQLGKTAGATVVAAVSSEEKAAVAIASGADRAVIYPSINPERDAAKLLSEELKKVLGPNGANVICDTVGGNYAEPALRGIAWNGRYLVVGFPAGVPRIPANLVLLKGCQLVGVFWGAFTEREPNRNRVNTQAIFALWEEGKIHPHVSARFSLPEGAKAIEALASRRALGKVIVQIT